MKKTIMALSICLLTSIVFPCLVTAHATADPVLTAEINKIKVIDHHAHPLVAVNENEKDTGWDELSLGSTGETQIEGALIPYRLSPASPELINVWPALALTGMMNDGEITSQQAIDIAREVLRENAIKLYKLNGS